MMSREAFPPTSTPGTATSTCANPPDGASNCKSHPATPIWSSSRSAPGTTGTLSAISASGKTSSRSKPILAHCPTRNECKKHPPGSRRKSPIGPVNAGSPSPSGKSTGCSQSCTQPNGRASKPRQQPSQTLRSLHTNQPARIVSRNPIRIPPPANVPVHCCGQKNESGRRECDPPAAIARLHRKPETGCKSDRPASRPAASGRNNGGTPFFQRGTRPRNAKNAPVPKRNGAKRQQKFILLRGNAPGTHLASYR